MSEYNLDELERLEQAATPGPWEPNPRSELCVVGPSGRTVAAVGQYSSNVDAEAVYAENLANGGLITAARNALPAMIRDLRELRYYKGLARSQESTIHAMRKQCEQLQADLREAKCEADALANSIYNKYYRTESPEWSLLDSVSGVITQISNMVAGMSGRLREAREIMLKIEWAGRLNCYGVRHCPTCDNMDSSGHAPDCRLKAWLERMG